MYGRWHASEFKASAVAFQRLSDTRHPLSIPKWPEVGQIGENSLLNLGQAAKRRSPFLSRDSNSSAHCFIRRTALLSRRGSRTPDRAFHVSRAGLSSDTLPRNIISIPGSQFASTSFSNSPSARYSRMRRLAVSRAPCWGRSKNALLGLREGRPFRVLPAFGVLRFTALIYAL
jgi:hypothetical protein